jgi:glutaredoxin
MIRELAMTAALAFTSLAGAQMLCKSVGPDGKVTYGDRPPAEGTITKTMRVEDLPNTALSPSTVDELELLRKSGTKSGFKPTSDVVLFAASWCGYCRQARSDLAQKGIRHQEVDIDTANGKKAFIETGGVGGIPLLLAKGQQVRGFRAQTYDVLFASR